VKVDWKSVLATIVAASIVWIGGTVASHEGRISNLAGKLDMIHEDVKTIKALLLKKGLDEQ
jgi:hypothetical protein